MFKPRNKNLTSIKMTKETHTNMFNTITKYELVEKNRVKNCLACNKDLVPNDEKKKLNKYTKTFTSSGYRIDYQFPEGKDFGRVKEVPYWTGDILRIC